tara:strand:+ start:247 stop:579 length:333 start_codon:yes stop_codon:yes gene_type:complete
MDKIIEKLNKALTESERDNLIGHLAYHYEKMRFNGTVGMVKDVYGIERSGDMDNAFFIEPSEKNYVKEKTRNFFNCGAAFVADLDTLRRKNFGGVLYNYLLKEMKIGGAS